MKKFIILFIATTLAISCSSDEGNGSNFTSDLVVDGIEFRPNTGTYGDANGQLAGQTGTFFAIQRIENDQLQQALYINVLYPVGSDGPEGVFDFGPGTADEFLANASFSNGSTGYSVVGTSVTVTRVGQHEFLFEFNDPVALDFAEGFAEKPMSGSVRAKLTFTE